MTFARWVFRLAGIYGLIVMTPMLFLEPAMTAAGQPLTHPEHYYGFVGVVLVFQLVFLTIAADPARYRPIMLLGVAEKLAFVAAVYPLFLLGRTPAVVAVFATIDLFLAVMFAISWRRTRAG
jgi:hypothetical protein